MTQGEDRFGEVVPDLHDQGDAYLLDKTHWPVGLDDLDLDDSLYTIEATAYALMQKLELGRRNETHAIANWLLKKRQLGGGFRSTQVTKRKLGVKGSRVEGWVASRSADTTGPSGAELSMVLVPVEGGSGSQCAVPGADPTHTHAPTLSQRPDHGRGHRSPHPLSRGCPLRWCPGSPHPDQKFQESLACGMGH